MANLTSPTKSFVIDDAMEPSRDVEFAAPQSRYTTVLVVGATGRVGRILVRKLLLRGYKVKALVRRREGKLRDELQAIPSAVEIVEGDVGDVDSCQQAVRGVSKVGGWVWAGWGHTSGIRRGATRVGSEGGAERGAAGAGAQKEAPRFPCLAWRWPHGQPPPSMPHAGAPTQALLLTTHHTLPSLLPPPFPSADHLLRRRAHHHDVRPAARGRPGRNEPGQGHAGGAGE